MVGLAGGWGKGGGGREGGREGVESVLALSRSMFAISLIEMARSSEHISSHRFIYLHLLLRFEA